MKRAYSLPRLFKKTSTGATQIWDISVYHDDSTKSAMHTVVYGQIDGKKQNKDTVFTKGKNIGRSNETSPFQQAELEAESIWRKQKDKGYVESIEEINTVVIRPMLAHKYSEHKNKVKFPVLAQAKYDGARSLAIRNNGKLSLISRLGKPIVTMSHIEEQLADSPEHLVIDGELYLHGEGFQEIISAIKRDEPSDKSHLIEFHVYDLINLSDLNMKYKDRIELAFSLFAKKPHIKLVESLIVNNDSEVEKAHQFFVDKGYEGCMLRNIDSTYKIGKRSHDLLKVKSFLDAEFKITGVSPDKNDECVFMCVTADNRLFYVKPKGSHEVRQNYWKNARKCLGKMLTVQFFEYSNVGVPRFPVGLAIRDYE